MVAPTPIKLPDALVSGEDYKSLNSEQRRNLAARLDHCKELAAKAADTASSGADALLVVIDGLELDAMILMSIDDDAKTTISPWLVHSSWMFECDRRSMIKFVAPGIIDTLQSAPTGFTASNDTAKKWLGDWSKAQHLTLTQLEGSSSFTEAIAHLIVVDALVCSLLVFAAGVRLNANIS